MATDSSLPALVDAAVARALYDFDGIDLSALETLVPDESMNVQQGDYADAKTVEENGRKKNETQGGAGYENGGVGDEDGGVRVEDGVVGVQEGGEAKNSDPRPPLPQEASGQGKSGGKNLEAMLKTYREENPENRAPLGLVRVNK